MCKIVSTMHFKRKFNEFLKEGINFAAAKDWSLRKFIFGHQTHCQKKVMNFEFLKENLMNF